MVLWRISNHLSLAGEGGLRASGRWHTRGRRIVYCAESAAAALLEVLVHFELEIGALPRRYRLLRLVAPDDVEVERVGLDVLPRDWIARVDVTRAIGDGWFRRAVVPLLSVPSAIVPETFNVLLNPAHAAAARITVVRASEHVVDPRLLE